MIFTYENKGLEKHAKLVTAPCFVHRVDAKATVFREGTPFSLSSVHNGAGAAIKTKRKMSILI
jgi:hypothetical protein